MSDSTRRALRTGITLVLAILAAGAVAVPAFDTNPERIAKYGALITGVTVLLTKVQNMLEDAGTIPALLKAPASDGADPVPDPEQGDSALDLLVYAIACCVVLWLIFAVLVPAIAR